MRERQESRGAKLTPSCIYVAGTIFVFQASGLHPVSEASVSIALAALVFFHQALLELAEIWPAAGSTAESLLMLQSQYCVAAV